MRVGAGQWLHPGLLFAGLGRIGIATGIRTIVANFSRSMLKVYSRIGCEVNVLGSTRKYGELVFLGSFEVSELQVARISRGLRAMGVDKPDSIARASIAA